MPPSMKKIFRAEETMLGVVMQSDEDRGHQERHAEIMDGLRVLRDMIANGGHDHAGKIEASQKVIESYQSQLSEARRLKIELDIIDDAIQRTKGEMVTLQSHGLDDSKMARATQDLAAVTDGTTDATERILRAAEMIEQAAGMLGAALKNEHERDLAHDIQDQVTQIFEACNFHDLTSQRITRVHSTLRQVEDHIAHMMEIWSAIERFTNHVGRAPVDGDDALLNGPKLDGEQGHSSQSDIDALFR